MNGVSLIGAEHGVIEFAGDAPSLWKAPGELTTGRAVFSGSIGSHSVLTNSSIYSVDVSSLSAANASKISPNGDSSFGISELITNSDGASPSGFSSIGKTVVGASASKYSNEDFEKAANEGRNLSDLLSYAW